MPTDIAVVVTYAFGSKTVIQKKLQGFVSVTKKFTI
jgi:hypothetical protein